MQEKRSYVGPRGWAMLILVVGATLASPFLRPPQVAIDNVVTESPLAYTNSPSQSAGQLTSARSSPDADAFPVVKDLTEFDRQRLGGAQYGEPTLPSWATPPSPLDALISQGTAPPWKGDAPQSRIQPLRPWSSDNLKTTALPSTLPSSAGEALRAPALQASPWESPRAARPLVPIATAGPSVDSWPEQRLPQLPDAETPAREAPHSSSGSLARATLRQKTVNEKSPPTLGKPNSRPQFVFQPGFQPTNNPNR